MADAGDEESLLIRAHDGVINVASIPEMIREFTSRIEYLFLSRGALECAGYTQLVYRWCQRSHLIPDPQGHRQLTLDQGAVDRCFQRMKAWVSLVASTLACEMPGFEVINSFQVFGLKPGPSPEAVQHHLRKIASTFKLPLNDLSSQFKDFARTAGQIKSQLDCEDMEAWKLSVMKARPSYPHKELLSVVARGLALMNGGSTANNERDFAFNVKSYTKKSNRGLLKNVWRSAERQLHEASVKTFGLCSMAF